MSWGGESWGCTSWGGTSWGGMSWSRIELVAARIELVTA